MSNDPTVILFLRANPKGTALLRLDNEFNEINEKIKGSEFKKSFQLHNHGAVQADALDFLLI